MKEGVFITIEGPDGSGKSTQIEYIKSYLKKMNIDACFLREPGGTVLSEKIRNIILDRENINMTCTTEMLLYAAARSQLVEEFIVPKIKEGYWVVCDRYVDSSFAYQGFGRNLGKGVWDVNLYATHNIMPLVTILLSVEPYSGMARIENDIKDSRERTKDRLESEDMNFHEKVKRGYDFLTSKYAGRIISIDGNQSKEKIRRQIEEILQKIIESRQKDGNQKGTSKFELYCE